VLLTVLEYLNTDRAAVTLRHPFRTLTLVNHLHADPDPARASVAPRIEAATLATPHSARKAAEAVGTRRRHAPGRAPHSMGVPVGST
jgi:hypothetical protein